MGVYSNHYHSHRGRVGINKRLKLFFFASQILNNGDIVFALISTVCAYLFRFRKHGRFRSAGFTRKPADQDPHCISSNHENILKGNAHQRIGLSLTGVTALCL